MKKASLEKVQARFAEYVEASVKRPVLILRDGEPVAMLVGLGRNGKRKPTNSAARKPRNATLRKAAQRKAVQKPTKLRDVLRRAWTEYEKHGGIPHEQFWKEVAQETAKTQTAKALSGKARHALT